MKKVQELNTLIKMLLAEQPQYNKITIPDSIEEKKQLLRSLMNVRPPLPIDDNFLHIQDSYLQQELAEKGIVNINELQEIQPNIYLWQGDITRLRTDAIVNAANSAMLGCFAPCHGCIDNAIHSFAGVQLRLKCNELMQKQGHDEVTGSAKITPAYNLPSRYILHTVGPIIQNKLSKAQCQQLESCYRSCLELAEHNKIDSIAFCCISTGEFNFPNDKAAKIAFHTVTQFIVERQSKVKVIFNVYKKTDYEIYKQLLKADR